MKTLYMADLDGTILPGGDKLPRDIAEALNTLIAEGLPFTLNTSRTPRSIAPVLADLNLELPLILMNGALIYDTKTGKTLALNTINSVTAATVLNICKKEGLNPFMFDYKNGDVSVQYTALSTDAEREFYTTRLGYYKDFKKVSHYSPAAFTPYIICVGEIKKLLALKQKLCGLWGISCTLFINNDRTNCYLEIYSRTAGKANGATRFMKEYGFDRLVAFGDNLNDIEMLRLADYSLAVENAFDEVKAVANKVLGSCKSGAVVNWLKKEWCRK